MAFDDVEEATRDLVQQGDSEVISVAVPPMLLNSWMIPRLASFYEKYPQLKLRLVDTLRYLNFEKDQVDCSIRYGFGGWEGLYSEFLFSEDMCPVCSPLLLQGNQKLDSPEDLDKFRLIYTERRLVQWDNYLANSGYTHIQARGQLWFLNSIHTFEAVLSGLGVALVNREFAKEYLKTGQLIIPFELSADMGRKPAYFFVAPEKNMQSEKILAVQQWIKDISID
jgi:LysR family glycine cleavage system transcriptional activator